MFITIRGSSLFERQKIWVFKCTETKNLGNHWSEHIIEVKIDSLLFFNDFVNMWWEIERTPHLKGGGYLIAQMHER